MAHVHAPVIRSNEEIAAKAKDIHPLQFTGRVLLTVITAVFVGIGWVVGRSWYLTVFSTLWLFSRTAWLAQCIRAGYHIGRKSTMVEASRQEN